MKLYVNGLDIHLAGDTTSLCYCWRIERNDGVVMGFTDHDRDLTVDGTEFVGTTGITTTQIVRRLGLSVDNLELTGAIDDDAITTLDIERGLYDDAMVTLYTVNWRDTSQFDQIAGGTFGNVNQNEEGFEVEFRTRSHVLNQQMGRVYQRTCDTKLGSPQCGVDLSLSNHTTTATVVSVDGHTVTLNTVGEENGWFTLGKMIDAEGAEHGIKTHVNDSMILWEDPVVPPVVGSVVQIVVGCKQDADTCRAKFNNILNFQAYGIYIPGNDSLTEYPIRGADDYNGGSIFK